MPATATWPARRPTNGRPAARSPVETERLIEAAVGTTPRALRDRALVELLYGAGLRVSEAVGLEKNGVALEERVVRVLGKGDKERLVPLGRPAAEAVRRYLALGRPHLDRRYRPELFLNARGGALTRAGAFLVLRKLADRAGLEPWVFGIIGFVSGGIRRWLSREVREPSIEAFTLMLAETVWLQIEGMAARRGITVPDTPVRSLLPLSLNLEGDLPA